MSHVLHQEGSRSVPQSLVDSRPFWRWLHQLSDEHVDLLEHPIMSGRFEIKLILGSSTFQRFATNELGDRRYRAVWVLGIGHGVLIVLVLQLIT